MEKHMRGPKRWEAQTVCHENGQRQMSLPVFSHLSFLNPPLTPFIPPPPHRLRRHHQDPPPSPLHPKASRSWLSFFSIFFNKSVTTTSLASKRELEVVLFGISTRLPPLPPPSCPNASRSWIFQLFRYHCHCHCHPWRVQVTRCRRCDIITALLICVSIWRSPQLIY